MYDWEKQIAKCAGAGQKSNKSEQDPLQKWISIWLSLQSHRLKDTSTAPFFVDDHTGYKWLYGLKTKDEALNTAKRWMAEIADLREKHPLLVGMRDNAKENSSKAICDYFTPMGVKNYYSAGYEPWQDGLAEASIK